MDLDDRSREILSVVAHDLRGPLQIIQGYAGMLLEFELDPAGRRKCLESILKATRWTEVVVGDLVDLEAMSRGKLSLRRGPVRLDELASEVCEASRFEAQARKRTLECAPSPGPFTAFGDADRLRQVLQNLISNALRHAHGRVEVSLAIDDDGILLAVRDDGDGLDPAGREALFGKWSQGSGGVGSLGLGLFIAERIVEAHGGRLWAENAASGLGACFSVCLPVRAPAAAAGLVPVWQSR